MELQFVLDGYIEATNSKDFTNVATFVAEDATYWFQKNSWHNQNEIKNYFETTWATIIEEEYKIYDIEWIGIDNSLASCIYSYKWSGFYKNEYVEGTGRGTNVLKKINNKWKIIHEHLSPM